MIPAGHPYPRTGFGYPQRAFVLLEVH